MPGFDFGSRPRVNRQGLTLGAQSHAFEEGQSAAIEPFTNIAGGGIEVVCTGGLIHTENANLAP